jgi:hypothetical protein
LSDSSHSQCLKPHSFVYLRDYSTHPVHVTYPCIFEAPLSESRLQKLMSSGHIGDHLLPRAFASLNPSPCGKNLSRPKRRELLQ